MHAIGYRVRHAGRPAAAARLTIYRPNVENVTVRWELDIKRQGCARSGQTDQLSVSEI